MIGPVVHVDPLYPEATLQGYFDSDRERQMARIRRSIDAASEFRAAHPTESLWDGGHKIKGLAQSLQYYKDETFLTLYAFVSLDLCGGPDHRAERECLYTELLRIALRRTPPQIVRPSLKLEKQVTPSEAYLARLRQLYTDDREGCHPVWYLRQLGFRNKSPEGSTRTDALLTFDETRHVMFEAKFLSDISHDTKYVPERDQISRNLDAGLAQAGYDLDRFWYVFVSPERFRKSYQTRLYGYRLREYMDPVAGPVALRRDLPHLQSLPESPGVDYGELSRHIGWITWEEMCDLILGSPIFHEPEFPRRAFEDFFAERCLLGRGR
jgi:hypothetical protein